MMRYFLNQSWIYKVWAFVTADFRDLESSLRTRPRLRSRDHIIILHIVNHFIQFGKNSYWTHSLSSSFLSPACHTSLWVLHSRPAFWYNVHWPWPGSASVSFRYHKWQTMHPTCYSHRRRNDSCMLQKIPTFSFDLVFLKNDKGKSFRTKVCSKTCKSDFQGEKTPQKEASITKLWCQLVDLQEAKNGDIFRTFSFSFSFKLKPLSFNAFFSDQKVKNRTQVPNRVHEHYLYVEVHLRPCVVSSYWSSQPATLTCTWRRCNRANQIP